MGDFKVGTTIKDICYIVDSGGSPATGLSPTHGNVDPSGNRATKSASEFGNGWYYATFTPDEVGLWGSEFTVAGNYTIYLAISKFNIGGGVLADIEENIASEAVDSGDLTHSITTANDTVETTIFEETETGIYALSVYIDLVTLETAAEGGVVTVRLYNRVNGSSYTVWPVARVDYTVGDEVEMISMEANMLHGPSKVTVVCSTNVSSTRLLYYRRIKRILGD